MSKDFTPPQYLTDLPFDRVSTLEEIQDILNNPILLEEMRAKFKTAPISICSTTFQPYKVVDGVRYSLELVHDAVCFNGGSRSPTLT
jgi:hypothetical protein